MWGSSRHREEQEQARTTPDFNVISKRHSKEMAQGAKAIAPRRSFKRHKLVRFRVGT